MSYLDIIKLIWLFCNDFLSLNSQANFKKNIMKRTLFLLSVAFLVLTSCSKDGDSVGIPIKEEDKIVIDPIVKDKDSLVTDTILVQKIIYADEKGILEREMLYDGNKLVSITDSDGEVFKFTYTGDLITKKERINKEGEIDLTTEYTYVMGKLFTSTEKQSGNNFYSKIKYQHNTDNTIFYSKFKGDVDTGNEEIDGFLGRYIYKDGNLVRKEHFTLSSEIVTVSEFDTRNNPFKNILGYNLLLGDGGENVNNLLKQTYTSGKGANTNTAVSTYNIQYNVNNYPIEQILNYNSGNSVYTETTTFEY